MSKGDHADELTGIEKVIWFASRTDMLPPALPFDVTEGRLLGSVWGTWDAPPKEKDHSKVSEFTEKFLPAKNWETCCGYWWQVFDLTVVIQVDNNQRPVIASDQLT